MSKLFDALEKIQQQEEADSPPEQSDSTAAAAQKKGYLPYLLAIIVLVILIAAGLQLPPFKEVLFHDRPTREQERPPISGGDQAAATVPRVGEPPAHASPRQQMEFYNKKGLALSRTGDFWSALYYFDKAAELGPQQPEPLLNMAILLSRLDLGFPAGRLFREAYELAPDNEHLRQAVQQAIAEQILPPDFPAPPAMPDVAGE
ncbi:MAG: hypothetical protein C0613_09165 [Desulfobulbaceae bacterium]|nr:MAG: hypothetical protein C0613_09165 [Desulfobulbaceae bacterium]